jgi:hypothetical protein
MTETQQTLFRLQDDLLDTQDVEESVLGCQVIPSALEARLEEPGVRVGWNASIGWFVVTDREVLWREDQA